jgi:acyl-CoA synthetase (AMP-forming)/AMP-acid ligase II
MAHERFSVADLGSIYMCSVGSAPLAPHALEALQERMPDASVSNNYGMTEAGSAYCVMPKGEAVRRPGSVGQPAPPAKVRIVDSQDGEVTAGEIGEVHLQMPGRQREYFNDPEASAALWGSDGWIRTGDVGKIDSDGYLYIIGRQKDVIIRGGNNVHASDVEHVISSHPDVLEVGVVGIEHEVLGEDVVAAVVLKSGATPNPDELRAFTLQQLTSYKVPRRWYVVDSLPRNPTGKVIKPELKSMLALLEPYVASP